MTDLEVIVVDDGSHDDTIHVLEDLGRSDKRVRVLETGGNGGPSVARNRALPVARGEWLAFLDADDWMEPERLERLLEYGRKGYALVTDNQVVHRQGTTFLRYPIKEDRVVGLTEVVRSKMDMRKISGGLGISKLFVRASLIEEHGLEFVPMPLAGDLVFLLDCMRREPRLYLCCQPYYHYVYREGSFSRSPSPDHVAVLIHQLRRFLGEHKRMGEIEVCEAFRDRIDSTHRYRHYRTIVEATRRLDLRAALAASMNHPDAAWWVLEKALVEVVKAPLIWLAKRRG